MNARRALEELKDILEPLIAKWQPSWELEVIEDWRGDLSLVFKYSRAFVEQSRGYWVERLPNSIYNAITSWEQKHYDDFYTSMEALPERGSTIEIFIEDANESVNTKHLYNKIMENVSKQVKKSLNENELNEANKKHKWLRGVANQIWSFKFECDSAAAIEGAELSNSEREILKSKLQAVLEYIESL